MATCKIQYFSLFLVCLSFLVIIPRLQAHIAEFDDFWRERQLQALENLNNSYHPSPEEVIRHFNEEVGRTLEEITSNTTRRVLIRKDFNAPCEATNPIDQCWRCDPHWEKNRKRLADCAMGFARGTIGGKNGEIYVVTDCADDILDPKPGTLRHAVIQTRPLWIIFARSMVIVLKQELIMTSDKTIDGRGANVHITNGACITIQFVKNIIIHNVHIHNIIPANGGKIKDGENHHGLRTRSDGDGISLFGATNVWLDHLSMYKCSDGIIDAIQGSTSITISNCHFTDHNDVMLFGGQDNCRLDEKMQITLAFNHFGKQVVQRMPRVRYGFVHIVNNDYTNWIMYAIGGSQNPTIISQGNRFKAPVNIASKEVCKRECAPPDEWKKWSWRSEGDLLLNGAIFTQTGNPSCIKKYGADLMVPYKPGSMVPVLVKWSGTLRCDPNKPC